MLKRFWSLNFEEWLRDAFLPFIQPKIRNRNPAMRIGTTDYTDHTDFLVWNISPFATSEKLQMGAYLNL